MGWECNTALEEGRIYRSGTEWVIETSLSGRLGNVAEGKPNKQSIRHRRREKEDEIK